MSNLRFALTLFILLFLFLTFFCLNFGPTSSPAIPGTTISRSKVERVSERRVIFFLKSHKCGSSTVQNVLMRIGMKRELDFALPDKGNYLGNPHHFNYSMIPAALTPKDGRFDVFAHHTRLSLDETKQTMRSGSVWVTILREPASLFESIYSFYHMEKRFANHSLPDLLHSPPPRLNWSRPNKLSKFGLNQMAWDLGMREEDFSSQEKVQELLTMVEKEFDLVMISEYMEASVVLLADLMRWPLEEMGFLNLLTRPKRTKLSPEDITKLLEMNSVDATLYKKFLTVFKNKIQDYGEENMEASVERLLWINSRLENDCVQSTNNMGYAKTISYKVKDSFNPICEYATKSELAFTAYLRQKQNKRLETLRKLRLLFKL